MNTNIRPWLYWIPGLILLILGMKSFVEKLPPFHLENSTQQKVTDQKDHLLDKIKSQIHSHQIDSLNREKGLSQNKEPINDPFRSYHPKPLISATSAIPKGQPPFRNFLLSGTIGNSVATISNQKGKKIIVKVGDAVDSATVIFIEPNKVSLQDRAGNFEISREP